MSTTAFDAKTETAQAEADRMRPALERGASCGYGDDWKWVKSVSAENPETPDPDDLGRKGNIFEHVDGSTLIVWARPPADDGEQREYCVSEATRELTPCVRFVGQSGTNYCRP